MNRVIWVMMLVSLVSVIGIYYTYHYGTSAGSMERNIPDFNGCIHAY